MHKMLRAPKAGRPSADVEIIILDIATMLEFPAAEQNLVVT